MAFSDLDLKLGVLEEFAGAQAAYDQLAFDFASEMASAEARRKKEDYEFRKLTGGRDYKQLLEKARANSRRRWASGVIKALRLAKRRKTKRQYPAPRATCACGQPRRPGYRSCKECHARHARESRAREKAFAPVVERHRFKRRRAKVPGACVCGEPPRPGYRSCKECHARHARESRARKKLAREAT